MMVGGVDFDRSAAADVGISQRKEAIAGGTAACGAGAEPAGARESAECGGGKGTGLYGVAADGTVVAEPVAQLAGRQNGGAGEVF